VRDGADLGGTRAECNRVAAGVAAGAKLDRRRPLSCG
jgi:hypothetical protein